MVFEENLKKLDFYKFFCKEQNKTYFSKIVSTCPFCSSFTPKKTKVSLYKIKQTFKDYFKRQNFKQKSSSSLIPYWRKDVFFVQASIYLFQPMFTKGSFKLKEKYFLLQECIRTPDLQELNTKRHLLSFTMLGLAVFNYSTLEYWIDETLLDSIAFLSFFFKSTELSFIPSFWEGGGNRGQCLEVFFKNLEIGTLVFMTEQFSTATNTYVPMEKSIVDVGFGLERIFFCFENSSLSACMGLSKRNFKKFPFSLLEKTRIFLLLFSQGITPGKNRGAYFSSLLFKAILEETSFDKAKVLLLLSFFSKNFNFKKFFSKRFDLEKTIVEEMEKVKTFREDALRKLTLLKTTSPENLPTKLQVLYESLGVPKDLILSVFPFFELKKQSPPKIEESFEEVEFKKKSYDKTKFEYASPFSQTGNHVSLKIRFYFPGGGGQEEDFLSLEGVPSKIEKEGLLFKKQIKKKRIQVKINEDRRKKLSSLHTFTHLLLKILKNEFGEHVFQKGSRISFENASLDVNCIFDLKKEEQKLMEQLNQTIQNNYKIKIKYISFLTFFKQNLQLFEKIQGNILFCKKIRAIQIGSFDLAACCGTHLAFTNELKNPQILKMKKQGKNTWRIIFNCDI